jgi:hypothetical protein
MIKEKKWYWWLTIFASPLVTTTLSPHIYVSRGYSGLNKTSQQRIIQHEEIHLDQQDEVGLTKYFFLYCFCLPLIYNPWRYNWEFEAYTKSGTSESKTKEYLNSWNYGWLR